MYCGSAQHHGLRKASWGKLSHSSTKACANCSVVIGALDVVEHVSLIDPKHLRLDSCLCCMRVNSFYGYCDHQDK
jgi:hypothetical protein